MEERSGLLQAGSILLLVGAILSAVGALMMLGFAIGFGVFFAALDAPVNTSWMTIFYGIMGGLQAIGAVFGFVAYAKAHSGDTGPAFAFGLVAGLLPPIQAVPLIGAILCKVCPEATQAP